tara:strand:- start:77 stop:259 length:183 start_codon:yes stop_codon:yes gene_type:complete
MRCKICDTLLTPNQSVKKDSRGNFRDTCHKCDSEIFQTLNEFEIQQYDPNQKKVLDDEGF